MIHNASNHPVLVKKISLKVWTLRAEIESIIAKRMSDLEQGKESDPAEVEVSALQHEYTPGVPHENLLVFPKKKEPATTAETTTPPAAEATAAETPTDAPAEGPTTAPADNPFAEMIEGEASAEPAQASAAGPDQNTSTGAVSSEEEVIVLQRRPVIPAEELFMGKTLLSEVYMDRIHFFCDKSFLEGQSIVIQFMIPQCFTLNADVMYCRRYGMKSRIISENKLLYRVAAKFTYLHPGERTLLRRFLQAIEPSVSEQMKAKGAKEAQAASTAKAESDDVMGDLDNLDL